MKFFKQSECDERHDRVLAEYDALIQSMIPSGYGYPIRMRDWELSQLLLRFERERSYDCILDTGCVNTFLPVWLSQYASTVWASDLLRTRAWKNFLRRVGVLKRKPTEAPYRSWRRAVLYKTEGRVQVTNVDLTRIEAAAESFDCITSISVIEHIPAVEKALAEMYRCLKSGGRLFLTTDCAEVAKPYGEGVRYFDYEELRALFEGYPVTTPWEEPDFARENWCYDKSRPVVTAFVEITKG